MGFKKKIAFTLAEVLIVIGIIGIIAQMTIPTLVAQTQKNVLKSQFNKMVAEVSQAIIYTKLELGVDNLQNAYVYYNGTEYVNAAEFVNAFYRQLKVIGTQSYSTWPVNYNNTATAYWWGIGEEAPNQVLADGSSINCMINAWMINISVDVNGPLKKPNKTGYDIFGFYIDSRDVLQTRNPVNWPPYYICTQSSNSQTNGLACSYYALMDKNPDDPTKGYWDSLK